MIPGPADPVGRLRHLVEVAASARAEWVAAEVVVGSPDFAVQLARRKQLEHAYDMANLRVAAVLEVHLTYNWIVNAPQP